MEVQNGSFRTLSVDSDTSQGRQQISCIFSKRKESHSRNMVKNCDKSQCYYVCLQRHAAYEGGNTKHSKPDTQ